MLAKKGMTNVMIDDWNAIGHSQMDMVGTPWVKIPTGIKVFKNVDKQWHAKESGTTDWIPTNTPFSDAIASMQKFQAMKSMKAMNAMKPMKAMKGTPAMKAMTAMKA